MWLFVGKKCKHIHEVLLFKNLINILIIKYHEHKSENPFFLNFNA